MRTFPLRGARIVRVRRLAGKAGGPVQRRFGQGGGPSLGGRRRRAYSARMSRQRQIHYLTWIGAILPGIVAAILVFFLWGSTRDRQLPPQGGRPVGRATFDWSDFGGPLSDCVPNAFACALSSTNARESDPTITKFCAEPLGDAVAWIADVGGAWDERLGALGRHLSRRRRAGA